jgi:ubiquinone/menaquinone biosynthesis C-methylase UbiE
VRRTVVPELLDEDAGTPQEVAASLADLRLINRCFGGSRTTLGMVREVARQTGAQRLSLLEVASATGDVPRAVQQEMAGSGVEMKVTLLDRQAGHLPWGAPAVAGDALALPFRDASFDLVSCALLVHQLEPPQVLQAVEEGLRVARVAVLINDLRRSALHLALVYVGFALYRSRLTRHDAPASVRRSYTQPELFAMLRQTRAARIEIHLSYLFRMGAIAWKR